MLKPLIRALSRETAYPVIILTQSVISFTVMGLANYGRDAAPGWHLPMTVFLLVMSGLALRDLRRARVAVASAHSPS